LPKKKYGKNQKKKKKNIDAASINKFC
jgi:hypothetical protein